MARRRRRAAGFAPVPAAAQTNARRPATAESGDGSGRPRTVAVAAQITAFVRPRNWFNDEGL